MINRAKILIRPLQLGEIPLAVAIHEAAFPDFFLTFLGPDFLKLLYRFYIVGGSEIALAGLYRGRLIATLLGTTQPQRFYKRLATRYAFRFALATLKPLLKRPSILPRLLRALFYRGDAPTFAEGGALLASICANLGLGPELVAAFEAEAFWRGAKYVYLTMDRDNNENTQAFYGKLGWEAHSEFITPEGRAMLVYCKFPPEAGINEPA